MSTVHHLFYSTDQEKKTLHSRIIPSEIQQELQQERWNDLADYLTTDLREVTEYSISSWLQGSYKFATQIRPPSKSAEFDIDLGVYFNWSGEPDSGKFSARELKSFVQESLNKYKAEAGDDVLEVVSPPKSRCSRIRFKEGFHIDVPSYHLDPQKDLRSLATEDNIWEDSDPKALYLWFQSRFTDGEKSFQLRRIVKYMKMWAALHFPENERPSSVLLTVLATESFINLSSDQLSGDDETLEYVIKGVIERLVNNSVVLNPVNSSENLNRLDESQTNIFLEKLNTLFHIVENALNANTEIETACIWSEVFFHFFPLPESSETDSNGRSLMIIKFDPQVAVRAIPKQNPHKVYNGKNRIGPIPKQCKIEFKLINAHDLHPNAQVHWMVRNEDDEAAFENDLGHPAGLGNSAQENSAYKGTHYMDVIVKSPFNDVIGFRRIPVEIAGYFMPPRNPKKPGYTRIRRRR